MTDQPRTVADAMLSIPKLCGPQTTADDLRRLFDDDHVHIALVVANGRLLAAVERDDLAYAEADQPAHELGELKDRTTRADANLEDTRQRMRANRIRRLAVVDERANLLGLLCLKRAGHGFCSDDDVSARAVGPGCSAAAQALSR